VRRASVRAKDYGFGFPAHKKKIITLSETVITSTEGSEPGEGRKDLKRGGGEGKDGFDTQRFRSGKRNIK